MANLSGMNMGAAIVPFTDSDIFPTHEAIYGKGGKMEVADITARDAIPAERRTVGMFVTTQNDGKTYQLVGGVANSNWEEFTSGGGNLIAVEELPETPVPGTFYASIIGQPAVPGPEGPKGESATIAIGSVTTVSSSTPATVVNVGTDTNAILDFNIPMGERGFSGLGGGGADVIYNTPVLSGDSPIIVPVNMLEWSEYERINITLGQSWGKNLHAQPIQLDLIDSLTGEAVQEKFSTAVTGSNDPDELIAEENFLPCHFGKGNPGSGSAVYTSIDIKWSSTQSVVCEAQTFYRNNIGGIILRSNALFEMDIRYVSSIKLFNPLAEDNVFENGLDVLIIGILGKSNIPQI